MLYIVKKKATHLCTELSSLCWIVTVLEGPFGEYHSSLAALGQQCQEVTKQPLYVIAWQPRNSDDVKIVTSLILCVWLHAFWCVAS